MKLLQGITVVTGLSLSLAAFAQGDLIYRGSLASRPNILWAVDVLINTP